MKKSNPNSLWLKEQLKDSLVTVNITGINLQGNGTKGFSIWKTEIITTLYSMEITLKANNIKSDMNERYKIINHLLFINYLQ
jgi:hypothetical protein